MKTLRYLLMTAVVMTAFGLSAQQMAQYPAMQMHSTSGMVSSGSTLPMAAVTGAYTTYDAPAGAGPRRVRMEDNPFGDQTVNDITTPIQPGTPIGDAIPFLLLLAAGYALVRRRTAED